MRCESLLVSHMGKSVSLGSYSYSTILGSSCPIVSPSYSPFVVYRRVPSLATPVSPSSLSDRFIIQTQYRLPWGL